MAGVRVETACKAKGCTKQTVEFGTSIRTLDFGHQDTLRNSGNKCDKKRATPRWGMEAPEMGAT